jgi:hypothetical protein
VHDLCVLLGGRWVFADFFGGCVVVRVHHRAAVLLVIYEGCKLMGEQRRALRLLLSMCRNHRLVG